MTRSETDSERELGEDESGKADSVKLAKFLTPVPKPKSSMPPPPSPAALRVSPAPPVAKQRPSLFSDLPVPRKNSSLRPPADVTEAPRVEPPVEPPPVEPPRAEEPAPPVSPSRRRPRIEEWDETESPTGDVTLETSLREMEREDVDRDLDLLPLSRPPLGPKGARRAAIAAAALVLVVAVVFVARRALSPSPAAAPSSSPASTAALAREPNAPTDDTFETKEEVEFPTSAADPAKGRELRQEARRLLESGNAEEGVRVSRLAIQADPNEAEGYILLAAGLQDLGRWQESRDVFAKCVQESGRKANAECVYFATRSK
jgi:hypothetical protein